MTRHEPPNDELLSAYLDGELDGDELDYVERLLVQQPRARQLLDEMRALAGNVETLPRLRLERDFHETVLRRVEREMLSHPAVPVGDAKVHPAIPGDEAATLFSRSTLRQAEDSAVHPSTSSGLRGPPFDKLRTSRSTLPRFTMRSWLWAGLALAAGVLIMVFTSAPDGPGKRKIAQAPAPVEPKDDDAESVNERADAWARGVEAKFAKRGKKESDKSAQELDFAQSEAEGLGSPPADGLASPSAKRLASQTAEMDGLPKVANGARADAPNDDAGRLGGNSGDERDGEPVANKRAFSGHAGRYKAESRGFGAPAQREASRTPADGDADPNRAALGAGFAYELDSNAALMFVHVDVPSQANYAEHFGKVLAKQNITFEASAAELYGQNGNPRTVLDAATLAESDKSAAGVPASKSDDNAEYFAKSPVFGERPQEIEEVERARLTRDVQRRLSEDLTRQSSKSIEALQGEAPTGGPEPPSMPQDIVYVEATGEQIEAALAEINDESDIFLSLKVEPAAEDETQQELKAYNRSHSQTSQSQTRVEQLEQSVTVEARQDVPPGIALKLERQELTGESGVAPAEEQSPSPAKPEPSDKSGAAGGVGGAIGRDQKRALGLRPNELGKAAGARRSRAVKKGPRQLLPTARYRAVFVFNEVPPSDLPAASPPAGAQPGNP